jgi:uncharacterized protein (DUF1810 family)
MIVQTNAIFSTLDSLLSDGLSAGSWTIKCLNQPQHFIHHAHLGIRAIICTSFFLDVTGLEDSGQIFVCDANAGVGLTIFQENIVSRIILLDEGIFEE